MKCSCDDCLVCYVCEYSEVKIKNGIIVECSSYVPPTKENIEGIKKDIEMYS